MNFIDTNCVSHIFEKNISISNTYFLSPEIKDEVDFAYTQLPREFISIKDHDSFNEAIYIDFFKMMLNKHEGKSFFNMTGLGDISMLATIHTVLNFAEKEKQNDLFDSQLFIFTEDIGLAKKVTKEFRQKPVKLRSLSDIE